MNRVTFCGVIGRVIDAEQVRTLLENWLGTAGLRFKRKLSGPQFVYEDKGFYVYCHEMFGAPSEYLLEGHGSAGLDATRQRLEKLVELCRERSMNCILDDVVEDVGPPGDKSHG